MVHKVLRWIRGFVLFRIDANKGKRFVNVCRSHNIELWQIDIDSERRFMYCQIALPDFYKLRKIAVKCKVMPVITKRMGMPFLIGDMKKRRSFFYGMAGFFVLFLLMSTRIWGIEVEGTEVHTKDEMIKQLDTYNVYGGMAVKDVSCSTIEENIRQDYKDIGWVSVELKGTKLYIRLQEIEVVKKKKKQRAKSIVAQDTGKVLSIVTGKGTARVRKGDKVKKGKVLISGYDKIIGDNDEVVRKRLVPAEGTVMIESAENYRDMLDIHEKKKVYTGRKKNLYEWRIWKQSFFLHNPLNNLETYKKCDIIREGGQLGAKLSVRFPLYFWKKCYKEVTYKDENYSEKEAKEVLDRHLKSHVAKLKRKGYKVSYPKLVITKQDNSYVAVTKITRVKKQSAYKFIKAGKEGKKENVDNGNSGRNTG